MKVSIITVVYNSKDTISDAVNSVLEQTHENIEYIVIDGASKDGTASIVKSYGDRVHHFTSEPDKGIYDAMNKGLALATGEVIGILNSDDFYKHENVIAEVVKVFEANSGIDMVLGNVDFVDPGNLSKPCRLYSSFKFAPWKMRFGFMPAHPAAFIKRPVYRVVGNYKLEYKIGADFEWFVRAFLVHKFSFLTVDKAFVRMRLGGASTSGFKSHYIATKDMFSALSINGFNSFGLVLFRLPVKYFSKLLFLVSQKPQ